MINFHYTASLDENIKASRDITNLANPIAAVMHFHYPHLHLKKFKHIMEDINKQTLDVRKLIKGMSLK